MANNYVSQFTGDELDFAISSALGDKYRGNLSPGCHTIGASIQMSVDFDSLTIPGKYTAYFYTNGPASLLGVSPICIQVFWGSTMLYQTIQVGARLFWRDLLSGSVEEGSTHVTWKEVNLGVEATAVVDNLETDLFIDESASIKALSANMGAELRKRMENLQIGNANLMDFSSVIDDYGYKVSDRWSTNSNASITDVSLNEYIQNSAYKQRFPRVDDVDIDKVTIFKATGNAVFGFSSLYSNPIQMAKDSMYTASVYILCESNYFNADGSCKFTKEASPTAYIKFVNGADPLWTTEMSLYDLFEARHEERTFIDKDEKQGETDEIKVEYSDSIGKTNGYVRLTVTYKATATIDYLGIQFGINGANDSVISEFVYPKIEYGQYATQYNHSWRDLYYYFNNCEEIYGRPITVNKTDDNTYDDWISEQSAPVFDYDNKEFNVEPVAVGGGGGFIKTDPTSANSNPRKDQIIIFDEGQSVPGNSNYRIRGLKAYINGAWSTLCNSPMTLSGASNGSPSTAVQADCGWLDTTTQDEAIPATLKYFDGSRWRPVGAVATEVWFMQPDVPTDKSKINLIWIKEDTRAPYIYDKSKSKWVPLLALWGSPNT